jgi:hypothetical protein
VKQSVSQVPNAPKWGQQEKKEKENLQEKTIILLPKPSTDKA